MTAPGFIHLSVQIEAIDFAIKAIRKDARASRLPMASREAELRVEYLEALKRTMRAIEPHREAILDLIAKAGDA